MIRRSLDTIHRHGKNGPELRGAIGSRLLPLASRLLPLASCLSAIAFAPLTASAQTAGRAYCNVTGIESERLVNAVQVTIRADGLMSPDIESQELFNTDAARMGLWEQMGKRVRVIPIRVRNARSQVGSIAKVGIYPVSHVEVSVPPTDYDGIGVDVRIVLYKPAITREVRLANDRWNFGAPNEAPPFISIEQSQDRRSIVVIVTSDRRTPEPLERRKPADPSRAVVSVGCQDGLVSIYALDADMRELIRELARVTGKPVIAAASLERTVSLSLDGVPLDDALDCIARTYGVSLDRSNGAAHLSDGTITDAAAYAAGQFEPVALNHITAGAARDSLPDVLLDHVQVDAGHNALTVAGPRELVEKVRDDVARLDRPAPTVEVTVTAVQFDTAEDLSTALGATLRWGGGSAFLGADGDIRYSSLTGGSDELQATLRALAARGRARIKAETRTSALNGQTAKLFVGREKRMAAQYFDSWTDSLETRILTIKFGTSVEVTPWTSGDGTVTATIRSEVSDVTEIEPITGNPTISQRMAETTVRLTDGETLYIGGLDMDQAEKANRTALFGGLLYPRSRSKTGSRLAVFVTARTIVGGMDRAMGSEQRI